MFSSTDIALKVAKIVALPGSLSAYRSPNQRGDMSGGVAINDIRVGVA